MRATTGAAADALQLQMGLRGDVLDVSGGQSTLLRFFSTPHDLRRINELGHLGRFVRFLRRTLVGDFVYKTYISMIETLPFPLEEQASHVLANVDATPSTPSEALDLLRRVSALHAQRSSAEVNAVHETGGAFTTRSSCVTFTQ
jgi:hypothetical protein